MFLSDSSHPASRLFTSCEPKCGFLCKHKRSLRQAAEGVTTRINESMLTQSWSRINPALNFVLIFWLCCTRRRHNIHLPHQRRHCFSSAGASLGAVWKGIRYPGTTFETSLLRGCFKETTKCKSQIRIQSDIDSPSTPRSRNRTHIIPADVWPQECVWGKFMTLSKRDSASSADCRPTPAVAKNWTSPPAPTPFRSANINCLHTLAWSAQRGKTNSATTDREKTFWCERLYDWFMNLDMAVSCFFFFHCGVMLLLFRWINNSSSVS